MYLPPMVCRAWLLVVGGQVQSNRVCVQKGGAARVVQHPSSGSVLFDLAKVDDDKVDDGVIMV